MVNWIKTARWTLGTSLLGGALAVGVTGLVSADQDGYKDEYRNEYRSQSDLSARKTVSSGPGYDLYVQECGACHLAYPAGFLPERSWTQILNTLDDHFGENAEVDQSTQADLQRYLSDHAAETGSNRRSMKFVRWVDPSRTPLRITELSYFKDKHDEVPKAWVFDNPEVGSFSQCQACHGDQAQRGVFDDDRVTIPGHGRWDD